MSDAYEALKVCMRALQVHVFRPHEHDRDICADCGANFRADCHLTVDETTPERVRAEAFAVAWDTVQAIEADRRRRRKALDELVRLTEEAGLYPWQHDPGSGST